MLADNDGPSRNRGRTSFSLLPALIALASCAIPPTPGGLTQVTFDQLPGWQTDTLAETLPALRAGCHRFATLPADTQLGGTGVAATAAGQAGKWLPTCAAAAALSPGEEAATRRFYEAWFTPYRIDTPGLFTGYYEPELRGALQRGGPYQTPVLARPADLVQTAAPNGPPTVGRTEAGRQVAYWSRADIEAGRMGAEARPLIWLADPVDLFFLQIQGAGRIRLSDGTTIRLGYDGKNGRPYTPIGRVLVARHDLPPDGVSMQSIRAWLAAHPAQAQSVMNQNEDYVFFRVLPDAPAAAASGPPGALGVALTPGRTAAIDRHSIPLGAPLFVDTTDPLTHAPWRRLLLAQDVGSDIVGAARTDIFLGTGAVAAAEAGRMHEAGTAYVLLPRK